MVKQKKEYKDSELEKLSKKLKTRIMTPESRFKSGKYKGEMLKDVIKKDLPHIKMLQDRGTIAISKMPYIDRYYEKHDNVYADDKEAEERLQKLKNEAIMLKIVSHLKLDLKARRVRYLLFLADIKLSSLFDVIKSELPVKVGNKNTFRCIFQPHIDIENLEPLQKYKVTTRSKIIGFTLAYLEKKNIEESHKLYVKKINQLIKNIELKNK